ncbi:MAG: energy-coupling factor transporter transmembrane protein EcfT [Ruminococcaceae bacterium]|nr:energy-coupling factor transporter transmembrane protein EcfT [Oscillospiraceae bacterium]
MKNVALGQYYLAKSPLHKADPRMKVILALLYIVCATFLCKNVISFALLLFSAVLLVALGRVPFKIVLGGLRPVLIIMVFTAFINVFMKRGDWLIFEWRFIHIYWEGIFDAIFMIVRIASLIIGTSMFLTYTTTPIQLTDALEDLLSPLKRLKVPVHDAAMMMTIALRFIPTLVDETDKIMTAQKARGADFSSGGLVSRAKALIPILIPLFLSAFRRADDLALAMECRCYHGGEGRTRMHVLHTRFGDVLALLIMLIFGAALVAFNMLKIGYTMR